MSSLSVLRHQHIHPPVLTAARLKEVRLAPESTGPKGRDHVWDLSPNLHCSIVGTCLTTGELRQFFAKLNEADAKTASDHALHHRAVQAAGQKDLAGKLLNKMLDRRHEAQIKRFAKAKTVEEVRGLWREALERGDIPGAYWAVLSHPATDHGLVEEVFGEVHMLSHLVGMSNRADIAKLRRLEQDLPDRDETIARQQSRLQQAALERQDLTRRLEQAEAGARLSVVAAPEPAVVEGGQPARQKLAHERARSAELAALISDQDAAMKRQDAQIAALEARAAALQAELAALDVALGDLMEPEAANEPPPTDLQGLTLLYVGGRPKLADQLRALVSRRGGDLISHDGGMEDKSTLLPGLVSQADAVFFPVDCVSHQSAGRVKQLCRDSGKPYTPLRAASLASFITALDAIVAAPSAKAGIP